VAVGKAYCVDEIFVAADDRKLGSREAAAEFRRFQRARSKAAGELRALYHKVSSQIGFEQASVFEARERVLTDPALAAKVRLRIIGERETVPSALRHLLRENRVLLAATPDEFLKRRLADLHDVLVRLSAHLSPVLARGSKLLSSGLVLVAQDIVSSQLLALGERDVAAVVTESGGRTSHAAMFARKRGIPGVAGVSDLLRHVQTGDTIVVDGSSGHVLINPDSETESAYRKLQREFFRLKDVLAENRRRPAQTACGQPLELLANINNVTDARAATALGASGVGLFRTEYLFLTHPDVPDEDEQCAAYGEIVAASPGEQVTIRTLDLGGDKTIPYLARDHEANPFMGWRSIRLSFEHPDFFNQQIRAVLRAAAGQKRRQRRVQLLFPMITQLEEIRRLRAMVTRARRALEREGLELVDVPIGLMLEVPAAAVMIRSLVEVVDFVSIGSNDLVQYLMAADRDNPKVSHLCQPFSPPVLRVLSQVITACHDAGKPVTLCGEMAGHPRAFLLLLGMGLRSFSMSPAFIPTIKDLASHVTLEAAQAIFRRASRLTTSQQVISYLGKQMAHLAPELRLLDTIH
jgi:phosphotransferase system enzyme I (PtsI)